MTFYAERIELEGSSLEGRPPLEMTCVQTELRIQADRYGTRSRFLCLPCKF